MESFQYIICKLDIVQWIILSDIMFDQRLRVYIPMVILDDALYIASAFLSENCPVPPGVKRFGT